jgi:hypothetical protein
MGQVHTDSSNETRVKELHQPIRLEQPDKSAMAEHSISPDHPIQLQHTVYQTQIHGSGDRGGH